MELVERADLYSKQAAKGGSSLGQKQKTAEKANKKGWRGKGFGGVGPSKGSISQIENSTVSAVAGTQCWAPFSVKGPKVAAKGPKTRWRQKIPKEKNYNHVTTINKCRNANSQIVH